MTESVTVKTMTCCSTGAERVITSTTVATTPKTIAMRVLTKCPVELLGLELDAIRMNLHIYLYLGKAHIN